MGCRKRQHQLLQWRRPWKAPAMKVFFWPKSSCCRCFHRGRSWWQTVTQLGAEPAVYETYPAGCFSNVQIGIRQRAFLFPWLSKHEETRDCRVLLHRGARFSIYPRHYHLPGGAVESHRRMKRGGEVRVEITLSGPPFFVLHTETQVFFFLFVIRRPFSVQHMVAT